MRLLLPRWPVWQREKLRRVGLLAVSNCAPHYVGISCLEFGPPFRFGLGPPLGRFGLGPPLGLGLGLGPLLGLGLGLAGPGVEALDAIECRACNSCSCQKISIRALVEWASCALRRADRLGCLAFYVEDLHGSPS